VCAKIHTHKKNNILNTVRKSSYYQHIGKQKSSSICLNIVGLELIPFIPTVQYSPTAQRTTSNFGCTFCGLVCQTTDITGPHSTWYLLLHLQHISLYCFINYHSTIGLNTPLQNKCFDNFRKVTPKINVKLLWHLTIIDPSEIS